MPKFIIRVVNATFQSCDEGAEYSHPEAALAVGIHSALTMLADEVNRGEQGSAVEVGIERADGEEVLRSVVSACVSPLMPRPRAGAPGSHS